MARLPSFLKSNRQTSKPSTRPADEASVFGKPVPTSIDGVKVAPPEQVEHDGIPGDQFGDLADGPQ